MLYTLHFKLNFVSIKSIKLSIFTTVNALVLGVFGVAYANVCQGSDPNCSTIPNPLGSTNTLAAFIALLLDTIFPIAGVVAVFFLIYSGFLMVMAGGNEEKLSKAKTAFLWTVIGIAILLGAKVLSAVICGTIKQLGTAGLTCPTP